MKNKIFIIGFMGAGKTTIGKSLSDKLSLPFLDTDITIEKQHGLTIAKIFEQKGEHYFRTLESKLIANLPIEPSIISCGGGFPCYNDNILKLKKLGKVIYLNADFETIYSRISENDSRPLIQHKSKQEIHDIYTNRKLYYQLSDIQIDNTLSLDEIINHLSLLRSKY
jgi:shikimate kinase